VLGASALKASAAEASSTLASTRAGVTRGINTARSGNPAVIFPGQRSFTYTTAFSTASLSPFASASSRNGSRSTWFCISLPEL
jgi:hypothetical protein